MVATANVLYFEEAQVRMKFPDGDGVTDDLDLNSHNYGICDLVEAGHSMSMGTLLGG